MSSFSGTEQIPQPAEGGAVAFHSICKAKDKTLYFYITKEEKKISAINLKHTRHILITEGLKKGSENE